MFKLFFKKFHLPLIFVSLFAQANITLAQQMCPSNLVAATSNARYTVLVNDAEVRDNATGLVWQRCVLGQTWSGSNCSGIASTYNFNLALIAANGAGSSGGYAWRLPNINEMKSLVEWACHSPSLNLTLFPNPSNAVHWTSSSEQSSSSSTNAWSFSFYPIATNNLASKNVGLVVRLVRNN